MYGTKGDGYAGKRTASGERVQFRRADGGAQDPAVRHDGPRHQRPDAKVGRCAHQ